MAWIPPDSGRFRSVPAKFELVKKSFRKHPDTKKRCQRSLSIHPDRQHTRLRLLTSQLGSLLYQRLNHMKCCPWYSADCWYQSRRHWRHYRQQPNLDETMGCSQIRMSPSKSMHYQPAANFHPDRHRQNCQDKALSYMKRPFSFPTALLRVTAMFNGTTIELIKLFAQFAYQRVVTATLITATIFVENLQTFFLSSDTF